MNGSMTGQELIAVRKKLGFSQTGLARRLDISRSSVWRYEVNNQEIPEVFALAMRALAMLACLSDWADVPLTSSPASAR